jgi:hypothetical protein
VAGQWVFWVLWFPPPINLLDHQDITEILLKVVLFSTISDNPTKFEPSNIHPILLDFFFVENTYRYDLPMSPNRK